MNRKFKAPPAADIKQWAKVQFLAEHGFRFGSIVDKGGNRVPYPGTLPEAREFVREYADVAKGRLTEDAPPTGKRIPRLRNATQGTASERRAVPTKAHRNRQR